jgi:hypothetical protein
MIRKLIILILPFVVAGSSCSEDLPDCPSKMCVMAGGWRLTEAYVDGEKEDIDLSNYRLVLNRPDPETSTVSDFNRIQISGNEDAGAWSIENNETILRLIPDNNSFFVEDWIIESFTPRALVLVINRDTGIKQGPSQIRFILEPF